MSISNYESREMTRKAELSFMLFRVAHAFCGPLVLTLLLFGLGIVPAARAEDSLCATVKIEIQQELTLERQAFDAHMRINNGLTHITLENVQAVVKFADADGNAVSATSDPTDTNALFFIRIDSMENIGNVDGSGSVLPSTSADIHWLIIPAVGAGGTAVQGIRYAVGAHLSYKLGGEAQEMEVTPDTIFVKPMPRLTLDYFLPHDVYGDDAFTADTIEPPVPFSLGVRIKNSGYGPARKVKIDSGQPKIVTNELGLLIGFKITGSEVNGHAATESLLVDFGEIAPSKAGTARWIMECTLSGRFVEFAAEYSHSDELGGRLTSLIDSDSIHTHLLVHDVLLDLAGRDAIRDFLAKDGDTYRVYESDNIDTTVTDVSSASALASTGGSGNRETYSLTVPPTSGPLFVQKTNHYSDNHVIVSVRRSDGKQIPTANAWFSKTRIGHNPWERFFNLFDINGGGVYYVAIEGSVLSNRPPVLDHIGDKINDFSFIVEASDPDGTIPTLTATSLPSGASFTTTNYISKKAEGTFLWTPTSDQRGVYSVTFTASDGQLTDEETITIYPAFCI